MRCAGYIAGITLVEGIKMSFGRYSHTPCVGSVKKYWQYIYTLYKRSLVNSEIDVRQIPRFSAFMHVQASSSPFVCGYPYHSHHLV